MFQRRFEVGSFIVMITIVFIQVFYMVSNDRYLSYRPVPNIHNDHLFIAKIDKVDLTKHKVAGKPRPRKKNTKTIIWYDIYNKGHGLRNKGKGVDFNLCPRYKNCVRLPDFLVDTKHNDQNQLHRADAVIFHGIHYDTLNHTVPRRKGQIFVFAERESGWLIGCDETFNASKYKAVFNWTMTFRTDSDIPMFYGDIIRKYAMDRKLLTEAGQEAKKETNMKSFSRIYTEKVHSVVWLVSHCKTYSLREQYVTELQKYIDVDIIGKCGRKTCPKKGTKECLVDIERKYKFILSFENTFQTDYITEKLYTWFSKPIIPVVLGLGNYTQRVPKGTFIDTSNFDSPKRLADYLMDVGSNKTKYIRYMKRKNQYFAVEHTEMQQQAYCKLCQMLNNIDQYKHSYTNIAKWWQSKDTSHINSFLAKNVSKIPHRCDEIR